jgi:ADP-heptose:LPS heptosyltransferase
VRADPGPILVVKLGALGDIAQCFGAFAAIRAHHRGQRVVLLTTPPFATALSASPWFDEVWSEERHPIWRLGEWLRLRRRIREAGFARIYDLQTNDRTDALFRLLGPGRRPEWVGRTAGASHRHADPGRDAMHSLERLAGQLAVAGVAMEEAPDLGWADADLGRLRLPGAFALLVPGAAPHRPAKRWPDSCFAGLATRLSGRGLGVALLGAPSEAALAARIVAAAPGTIDLTGRTSLPDLIALGRVARLAVGNDTGPMHWLAAAGAPCLTLFSADSDPALCAPRGRATRFLKAADLRALSVEAVDMAASEMLRAAGLSRGRPAPAAP